MLCKRNKTIQSHSRCCVVVFFFLFSARFYFTPIVNNLGKNGENKFLVRFCHISNKRMNIVAGNSLCRLLTINDRSPVIIAEFNIASPLDNSVVMVGHLIAVVVSSV